MNKKLLGLGVVALLAAGYAAVRNRDTLASAASTGRDRARQIAGKVSLRRRGTSEEERASDA